MRVMDDGHAGYMGAVRWVSFSHHGEPESGEAWAMDDGSVWARIAGPDPRGDDDRWVLLLDPAGVEAPGVSGVYDRDEAGEKLFDHLFGKGRASMDSGD